MEFTRTLHEIATFVSLVLTATTITGCSMVIYLWRESAINAFKVKEKEDMHWFIIGVLIAFIGALVDNIWWGFAWTADFYGHASRDWWFANGVYSNLIFRQLASFVAAYCHVRAAISIDSYKYKSFIRLAAVSTVIAGWGLIMTQLYTN